MDKVIQSLSRQYVTSISLLGGYGEGSDAYWNVYRLCHEHLLNVLKSCAEHGYEEAIDKLHTISRDVEEKFEGLRVTVYKKAISKFIERIYQQEDEYNKGKQHENQ